MAPVVLVVCEPPVRATLRVDCPREGDEDDDHRRVRQELSLPSPLPEWLRLECVSNGLQLPCAARAGESITQTGILAFGLLRLSPRGLVVYTGRLTSWPQHASFLWDAYHRPVDAMSARVVQAWRFQAPIALHHRAAFEEEGKSRRAGQYEKLDSQLKHQLFATWPAALADRADQVHGSDGRTLRQLLGSWEVQGLH